MLIILSDREKLECQIHNLANDLKSGLITWKQFDKMLKTTLDKFDGIKLK